MLGLLSRGCRAFSGFLLLRPSCLDHGRPLRDTDLPNFDLESRAENLELARLWSVQGLLGLFPGPADDSHPCRVFNSFKDASRDRQIGDRRLPNACERHLRGPSAQLPPGFLLTGLEVPRYTTQVVAYCSDRKDFYHQFEVTGERALRNALPFTFSREELGEEVFTAARKPLLLPSSDRDGLGWTPCFHSLFQGDHLGVEFALVAHESLLEACAALSTRHRLLNHASFPLGSSLQALVIDDLVNLSMMPVDSDPKGPSVARSLHQTAVSAYEKYERSWARRRKTFAAKTFFRSLGLRLDRASRPSYCCSPAWPTHCFGLLESAGRPAPCDYPGLVARLTGAWTSAFLFRRRA